MVFVEGRNKSDHYLVLDMGYWVIHQVLSHKPLMDVYEKAFMGVAIPEAILYTKV